MNELSKNVDAPTLQVKVKLNSCDDTESSRGT